MSLRSFNILTTGDPAAGDQNPATALARLRRGEAVNRFTGVNLVEDSNAVLGTTNASVDVDSAININTAGTYVIFGRTINLNAGGTIRANNNGVHIYFVNCNIIYNRSSGTNTAIGVGIDINNNAGAVDYRVSEGAANTRSVNFLGCSLIFTNGAGFVSPGDMFNSVLVYSAGTTCVPSVNNGSRYSTVTVYNYNGNGFNANAFEFYGIADLLDGISSAGFAYELTGNGAGTTGGNGSLVLNQPVFENLGQSQRFRAQGTVNPHATLQQIGPFMPFDNTRANTVGTSGTPYFNRQGSQTGCNLLYGWNRGYYDNIDLADESGVQNVRVRVGSNITVGDLTLNGTTNLNQSAAITSSGSTNADIDNTGFVVNYINEFYTNDIGRVVSNADTRFSSDGGTTFSPGGRWFDPLRFGVVDNPVGNTIHQNFSDNVATDNTVVSLITDMRGPNFSCYRATYEARSFSHRIVNDLENQDGLTTTDLVANPTRQLANASAPIDITNTIGAMAVGLNVKTENTNTTTGINFNKPDISFPAGQAISLNDIRDAYRAGWYDYDHNLVGGGDDTFNTPLNITLDNGHVPSYTATQGSITVRGNAINATEGDLYTNDNNINDLDLAGFPFSGQTETVSGTLSSPTITLEGITFNSATVNFAGNLDLRGWDVAGAFTPAGGVTITVTPDQAGVFFPGETFVSGEATINGVTVLAQTFPEVRTYQVPATLRNGMFGVRNINTDANLVPMTVIDSSDPATYSYAINSSTVGADTIRYYWRPNSTATEGYNTTIFDYNAITTGSITETQTVDLTSNRIPAVLWEDVINTDVGTASMTIIGDGEDANELNGIDRAEIQFVNSVGILNDEATGAARTLFVGITSINEDLDYIQRMIDNELTVDYIASGGTALSIDGAYCYLDSGDTNVQVVTAVTNSNTTVTDAQFIPNTFTLAGGGTTPTVIVLNNPLGATLNQIAGALVPQLRILNNNTIVASVKPQAVQRAQDGGVDI